MDPVLFEFLPIRCNVCLHLLTEFENPCRIVGDVALDGIASMRTAALKVSDLPSTVGKS